MIKKLILTSILAVAAMAASLTQGNDIPTLTIKDQFEKTHTVDSNVKTILFSATKEESATIRDFIDSKGKEAYLTSNNIAYIADITGMPSLITKFFALPKMQKYEFPILLIDEANKSLFPIQEDKISIIKVENGKISDIKYVKTAEELAANFK